MNQRESLWAQFMAAALTGALAAEREGFSYPHKAESAQAAARSADFALIEFENRFGKVKT